MSPLVWIMCKPYVERMLSGPVGNHSDLLTRGAFSRNAMDYAVRSALSPMGPTAVMGPAATIPHVW